MGCTLSVHVPEPERPLPAPKASSDVPHASPRASSSPRGLEPAPAGFKPGAAPAAGSVVLEWTASDVAGWLASLDARLRDLAWHLSREGIDGHALLYLDEPVFEELGLSTLQRKRVVAAIDRLRSRVSPASPAPPPFTFSAASTPAPPQSAAPPQPSFVSPPAPPRPIATQPPAQQLTRVAATLPSHVGTQGGTDPSVQTVAGGGVSLGTAALATGAAAVGGAIVAAAVNGMDVLNQSNVEGSRTTVVMDKLVEKAGAAALAAAAVAPGLMSGLQVAAEKLTGAEGSALAGVAGAVAQQALNMAVSLVDIAKAAPIVAPVAVALKMFYDMACQAIANKKNCEKMAERLRAHERVLVRLGATKLGQSMAFLDILARQINDAVTFVSGFAKKGWLKRVLSNQSDAARFAELQDDIDRTVSDLQLALQVEVFAAVTEGGVASAAAAAPVVVQFEDESAAAREYVAKHGGIQAVMEDPALRDGLTQSLGVSDQLIMGELAEIKAALAEIKTGISNVHDDVRRILAITEAATARPEVAILAGVPPPPSNFVDVASRTSAVIHALVPEDAAAAESAPTRSVVLYGFAGLGKSTITAVTAARHPRVRSAFRDGIVWLRIGQRPDSLDVLQQAASACHGVLASWNLGLKRCPTLDGDVAPGLSATAVVRSYLVELLAGRRMLLILDDVWDSTSYDLFRDVPVSVLVTTRSKALADAQSGVPGCSIISVDTLSDEDAAAMMAQLAGVRELPAPNGVAVVQLCKGVPLTIALIGASMKSRAPARDASWEAVRKKLQEGDTAASDTLRASVRLSIDDLPRSARKLLKALAFADASTPVLLGALAPILSMDDEGDLAQFVELLDGRCLAKRVEMTPAAQGILIPDAVLDVLRDTASSSDVLDAVLADAGYLSSLDGFAALDDVSNRWVALRAQWDLLERYATGPSGPSSSAAAMPPGPDPRLQRQQAYTTSLREFTERGNLSDAAACVSAARMTRYVLEFYAGAAAELVAILERGVQSASAVPCRAVLAAALALARAYLPVSEPAARVDDLDTLLTVVSSSSSEAAVEVAASAIGMLVTRAKRPRSTDDTADRLAAAGAGAVLATQLLARVDNMPVFRRLVVAIDALYRAPAAARPGATPALTLTAPVATSILAVVKEHVAELAPMALLCNSLRSILSSATNAQVFVDSGIVSAVQLLLQSWSNDVLMMQWIPALIVALAKGRAEQQVQLLEAGCVAQLGGALQTWTLRLRAADSKVLPTDGDLVIAAILGALSALCDGCEGAQAAASSVLPDALAGLADEHRGPAALSAGFTTVAAILGSSTAAHAAAAASPALKDGLVASLRALTPKLAARAPPAAPGADAGARIPVNERTPEMLVLSAATDALSRIVAAPAAAGGMTAALVEAGLPTVLAELQHYTKEGSRVDTSIVAVLAACRV